MDMTNRECERLIRAADKILEAVVKGGPDASLTMVVEGEGDENTGRGHGVSDSVWASAGNRRADVTPDEEKMLDALLDLEDGLSPWEVEFVDSIDKQRRRGYGLSMCQSQKLREIYERHC